MTTITLRSVKGSPLTNTEVDNNFSNLDSDKVERTSTTGSMLVPSGTTAQRDGTPLAGMFRYNESLAEFEGYTNAWGAISGGAGGDTLQDIAADSSDVAQYITFVPNTTGAQTGRVDAELTYNPSSNTLDVTGTVNATTIINDSWIPSSESIAATGTDSATAVSGTKIIVSVYGSTGTEGVRLDHTAALGNIIWLKNDSSNTLNVYPPTGGQINYQGADVPWVVSPYTAYRFFYSSTSPSVWSSL